MKKIIAAILPASIVAFLLIPLLSFKTLEDSSQSWSKLGQRKVNFKADKDEISGHWDGIFAALQVRVRGGSVSMQKMVVHFRNGESEEVELRNNFTDGSQSRVIDLPGKRRFIDRVVFWYDATSTTTGGKPVLELWGRH